jgi:hypothetical protein
VLAPLLDDELRGGLGRCHLLRRGEWDDSVLAPLDDDAELADNHLPPEGVGGNSCSAREQRLLVPLERLVPGVLGEDLDARALGRGVGVRGGVC